MSGVLKQQAKRQWGGASGEKAQRADRAVGERRDRRATAGVDLRRRDPQQRAHVRRSLAEVNSVYLEHRAKAVEAGNKFADTTTAGFDSTQAWSGRITLTVPAVAATLMLVCYGIAL